MRVEKRNLRIEAVDKMELAQSRLRKQGLKKLEKTRKEKERETEKRGSFLGSLKRSLFGRA